MKGFWTVLVLSAAGLTTGCPDDDVCTDCSCDPSLCDGGGDADADSDGDANTGSLTVTATAAGAEVAADIELDGDPTGYQTPHTFANLSVGTHSVLLSYPGRIQGPSPMETNVPQEGTEVNIFLYRGDLSGEWSRETPPGPDQPLTVEIRPPDAFCPDTWVRVMGASPINMLCVEADDSLSACKNRTASECGIDTFVIGQILEDGRRIEYDNCRIDNPAVCDPHIVYAKL